MFGFFLSLPTADWTIVSSSAMTTDLTGVTFDTARLPLTELAQLTSAALDTTRLPRTMYTFLVLGDALQFGLLHLSDLCNTARRGQVERECVVYWYSIWYPLHF